MSFNFFNCNFIEHLLSCHKAADKQQNSKLYLQVCEKLLPSVFVFINTREWPFQSCTEKVQIYVILLLPNLKLSVFVCTQTVMLNNGLKIEMLLNDNKFLTILI